MTIGFTLRDEFLAWLKDRGIVSSLRWTGTLIHEGADSCSQFWVLPEERHAFDMLLEDALELMEAGRTLHVWPKWWSWVDLVDESTGLPTLARLLQEPMPAGNVALVFGSEHRKEALDLLWRVGSLNQPDTLYVVPEGGRLFAEVDHHGTIHVEARSQAEMEDFVVRMAARGHLPPRDPPDETFKRHDSM